MKENMKLEEWRGFCYNERMKILAFKNYLAFIKNSVGSTAYRNILVNMNGQEFDIAMDGQRSCAYFISSTLCSFGLCADIHATVAGVEKDLLAFGWEEVPAPVLGSVLIWEKKKQGDMESLHMGFYMGNHTAISNDWVTHVPIEHHYTYDDTRRTIKILWHPKLSLDWII